MIRAISRDSEVTVTFTVSPPPLPLEEEILLELPDLQRTGMLGDLVSRSQKHMRRWNFFELASHQLTAGEL